MNRLQEPFREGAAAPAAGDYFVVSGECCTWYVSVTMARFIEHCLDARPRPKWLKFVDLTGARVRLRVRQVEYLYQCTAEQRAAERAFFRSLKHERKADCSWDEED